MWQPDAKVDLTILTSQASNTTRQCHPGERYWRCRLKQSPTLHGGKRFSCGTMTEHGDDSRHEQDAREILLKLTIELEQPIRGTFDLVGTGRIMIGREWRQVDG